MLTDEAASRDQGGGAPDAAILAACLLGSYWRAGYEPHPPASVRAPDWDTTLFVSGGIQPWRSWVLESGMDGEGRVGAQWCVRANRLGDIGTSLALTSFCMISAVWLGTRPHREPLSELITALGNCGITADRLAFIGSAGSSGQPADARSARALSELGIPAERIASRPHRWAQPFRPVGPAGPNLFVLAEVDGPCSAGCSPLCRCGRFVHFWNCEFLDYVKRADGTFVPADLPVTDSAGSLEWLACATAWQPGMRSTGPLRCATRAVAELLAEAGHGPASGTDLARLADHGRTVALLLADGVTPGPRGPGHLLRRLARSMLATLLTLDRDPNLLTQVIRAASASSAGLHGFPAMPDIAAASQRLAGEAIAFTAVVERGRRAYLRACQRPGTAAALADALFSIKADLGVPLSLLLAWSRADRRDVSAERIAALGAREREVSRGAQGHRGRET